MGLPFFFVPEVNAKKIVMDEDTSKHMIGVLRMQKEEQILLTDGKGKKAMASITDDNRKRCVVDVLSMEETAPSARKTAIGISLTKNASRFEWFLEKATELGITEIIPLICERTEKEKFRMDRMQNILVSAMLQSQQCWIPRLQTPVDFIKVLQFPYEQKYIAHCVPDRKEELSEQVINPAAGQLMLIGPEGDFTESEIAQALENNFLPVALGPTRLRTETAGIVAATLLKFS
jgi:16S rRNA (uracil1498-N3)-methyltransferase